MVNVESEPLPIVVVYTVPAKPVSASGTNLVPLNFNTWFVVAPVGSISMPSTVSVVASIAETLTVEGKDRA